MEIHEILNRYIQRKRERSTGFSLRWLALKLQISPSFLSRVLNGKKALPPKLIPDLVKLLDIEPEMASVLIQRTHPLPKKTASVETPLTEWILAETATEALLSEWHYLPILDFTSLRDFDGSAEMIGQRLGIPRSTVEAALERLKSFGLLESRGDKLVKSRARLRWSSARSLAAIRNFHAAMLDKAKEQLETRHSQEDFERRLITGITVTAPPDKIEAARKKLSECLHEIANALSEDPGTEVYHLSAQLFPLTKK